MRPQQTTLEQGQPRDSVAPTPPRRWLTPAHVAWCALVVLALGLFVASIPVRYRQLSAPPEQVQASLARLGLPVGFYAAYLIALTIAFAVGCFGIAAVIAWRKPDEDMALFAALFLVLLGAADPPSMLMLEASYPALFVPVRGALFLSSTTLILFGFLFPDGRFVPRRVRPLVLLGLAALLLTVLGGEFPPDAPPPRGFVLLFLGGLGAGLAAQVYRYARVSTLAQRQQTKWVVFGAAAATAVQLLSLLSALVFPSAPLGLPITYDLASITLVTCSYLLIPLSVGMAILKYRLWDIDVLISRTLVYGGLTACVIGLYVLVVGGLGARLQARGSLALSLAAAGLVAVLFQPLRARLQRGVNRLLYGERDEPYAVLSRLGQRLEGTLAPEAVLPAVVETVAGALKLPYAAIALEQDGASVIAAAHGTPDGPAGTPGLLRLSLSYRNEIVGELLLAPRAPGEGFSPADRRLLDDLARQAGIAAHAVRLTTDLQHSRERLVTAREEERRRLRRDLHDGLGPTLASLAQRLDLARALVPRDPDAAVTLLGELKGQVKETVADVRRLVYALRPPTLDEFGLVTAIREHAARQGEDSGLRVTVEAPEPLPALPAAVEVATYRIALEALTNVARHAGARACHVRLSVGDALNLEIADDGRGLRPGARPGVGLASMRERAAELGGSCTIESVSGGGTRIVVRLTPGNGVSHGRHPGADRGRPPLLPRGGARAAD